MPNQFVVEPNTAPYMQLMGKSSGKAIRVRTPDNFVPTDSAGLRSTRELTSHVSEMVSRTIPARALNEEELDSTLYPVRHMIENHPEQVIQAVLFGISQGMQRYFRGGDVNDVRVTLDRLKKSIETIFPGAKMARRNPTQTDGGSAIAAVFHIPSGGGFFVFYIVLFVDEQSYHHSSFTPVIAYIDGEEPEDEAQVA